MKKIICLVLSLIFIHCGGTEKRTARPVINSGTVFEEFSTGDYHIKAYENKNYSAEDWIYRFEIKKNNGEEREFALRTKVIQTRLFYLSEKLKGGWENLSFFDARPTYPIVKIKLIELLSRHSTPDSTNKK